MSELMDARHMLDLAELAAGAGDLASADELLRSAARIQEAELGPLHPEVASTFNNLAIVAEKAGRPGEAEKFYRRALAIVSTTLPPDHQMVADSRQNLEDFCRARGLPIEAPATSPSSQDSEPAPAAVGGGDRASAPPMSAAAPAAGADPAAKPALPRPSMPPPVSARSAPTPSQPALSAPTRPSRWTAWVVIGVIVLAAAALLLWRRDGSSETAPPAGDPTPPQAAAPAPAAPAAPAPANPSTPPEQPPVRAPVEQAPPPTAVTKPDAREAPSDTAAPNPSSPPIALATVQLCRTFSTNGSRWQCDPAGDSVTAGPIVLYTRVKSNRDAAVVHRWYRGDALRQSVKLTTRANATEGYRTFSRQTVDAGSEWRVEVRSPDGNLLHEQRFAVR